jgi:hypothetical protein
MFDLYYIFRTTSDYYYTARICGACTHLPTNDKYILYCTGRECTSCTSSTSRISSTGTNSYSTGTKLYRDKYLYIKCGTKFHVAGTTYRTMTSTLCTIPVEPVQVGCVLYVLVDYTYTVQRLVYSTGSGTNLYRD